MSTPPASAPTEALHRPVPDSLRAVGALSAAAALRARRPSHRVLRTLDLLVVAGVLGFALIVATAGPATASATEPAPTATTTAAAAPVGDPTVPAADDPAAPSGDPAALTGDPAAPSEDPAAVAQPGYPPPTVRACAPCYERRPPGPTRLGASAAPAEASGTPVPVAAAGPQAPPRPAAAFRLPATGSSMPTVAVAGFVLLVLGLALRAATGDGRAL
jgi:LPXTG-motif cell wall-anchored protein